MTPRAAATPNLTLPPHARTRARTLNAPEVEPRPHGDLHAFRADWLRWKFSTLGLSITGAAAISGLSRVTVGSILAGDSNLERVSRPTVMGLLRALSSAGPIALPELRRTLQISGDLPAWRAPSLPDLSDVTVDGGEVRLRVAVDPEALGGPHVYWLGDGRLTLRAARPAQGEAPGERLGRLLSMAPA